MNRLTNILLITNATTFLMAKIVIFLALVHFLFTTSMIHGTIITVCYLVMEVLDIQLKYMLKKSLTRPKLTIVDDITKLDPSERN